MKTLFSTVLIVFRETPTSFARSAWVRFFSARLCFKRLPMRTSLIGLTVESTVDKGRNEKADGQRDRYEQPYIWRGEYAGDIESGESKDCSDIPYFEHSGPKEQQQLIMQHRLKY
jgi:hypothetical protein